VLDEQKDESVFVLKAWWPDLCDYLLISQIVANRAFDAVHY